MQTPRGEEQDAYRLATCSREPDVGRGASVSEMTTRRGSMPEQAALDSAHLSRYDALLRTSKTLATHRTIGELFHVLGDELHPIIPFDYLALLLHDGLRAELRLVVLEPADLA